MSGHLCHLSLHLCHCVLWRCWHPAHSSERRHTSQSLSRVAFESSFRVSIAASRSFSPLAFANSIGIMVIFAERLPSSLPKATTCDWYSSAFVLREEDISSNCFVVNSPAAKAKHAMRRHMVSKGNKVSDGSTVSLISTSMKMHEVHYTCQCMI